MKTRPAGLHAIALAAMLAASVAAPGAAGASVSAYQTMPEDPRAVVVHAKGDGVTRPVFVFGGPDKRTLFILTHHALYATRIRAWTLDHEAEGPPND